MLDWTQLYAQRALEMTDTALRDMLTLTQKADIISFSGGLPAPELFPVERFRQAAELVLTVYGKRALQYSPTEGYSPLRRWVATQLNRYGMHVDENNVLITTGSQQASELIGRLLIDQGDPILVESPTYVGALQAFGIYRPRYEVVPTDGDGLVVEALEPYLLTKPKLLYLLPNFQNPSGTTLPLVRRQQLVLLSEAHGVPIVEDDPYSRLRYEGETIPPLVALDALQPGAKRPGIPGSVLYHGTFSKLLAPGLRIGWVVAPANVIQQLAVLKQGVDLHTGTLDQMIAYEVARSGFLDQHIERLTKIYRHRRNVMIEAMEAHFPDCVRWTRPSGGLFIFVTLPEGVIARDLLIKSLEQRVAFVPGNAFFPVGGGENTLRLNFSNAKPDRIVEGIKRLGKVLAAFCKHSDSDLVQ
jgi:2-aminoadipate transaminase